VKTTASCASRLGIAAAALGMAVLAAPAARGQDPQAMLQQYKCDACHAERETRTGPAYVDVAVKYRNDPKAAARLTTEVKRGAHGAGPWHMPPHPEVSDTDAKAMVQYILSLRE
jgi:cytochrome c